MRWTVVVGKSEVSNTSVDSNFNVGMLDFAIGENIGPVETKSRMGASKRRALNSWFVSS